MKLRHQFVALAMLFSLLLVLGLGALLAVLLRQQVEANLADKGLALARVLALDPRVGQALRRADPGLPGYVERLRAQTGAAYLVVTDRQGLRLSHPVPAAIGEPFRGDDLWPTLRQGRQHCSRWQGTLGPSIRCFAPVPGADGAPLGAVAVGFLQGQLTRLYRDQIGLMAAAIGAILLLGGLLGGLLLRRLRRTLLDLEPEYIARQFAQQELVLESIAEGILALDREERLTSLNSAAFYQLRLPLLRKADALGRPLAALLPELARCLQQAPADVPFRFQVLGQGYQGQWLPIRRQQHQVGKLLTFSRPEAASGLSHQLTHLQQYAELLRMQTHEYANKLNSLSGLLQLGHVAEAVEMIQQETEDYQALLQDLLRTIADKPVAGLILAKFSRARELGVAFRLDPDSCLAACDSHLSASLITLIGNLLDNGMSAAWANRQHRAPRVLLSLSDFGKRLIIEVEDSGTGVDEAIADQLFDYGVTGQGGDHGVGLYLVKETAGRLGGTLEWRRTAEGFTLFGIYIDKSGLTDSTWNPS
ncbi:sensor histidine kinase [Zobellella endophytica]|uniref:histidine kinase n=1 Tax=Zobellella endophytica TaxID=2116700 RepID=A0A2P7R8B7_9GAMM|nr:sensor histidine kinase [Zobellella endophytica]PSJ46486.1 sensor histidine kinase [Zobellella endophytica]